MAFSSKKIRTLGNIVKNLEIETYKCEMSLIMVMCMLTFFTMVLASFLLSKVKVSIRYVKFLAFEFHLGEVYKGEIGIKEARKSECLGEGSCR